LVVPPDQLAPPQVSVMTCPFKQAQLDTLLRVACRVVGKPPGQQLPTLELMLLEDDELLLLDADDDELLLLLDELLLYGLLLLEVDDDDELPLLERLLLDEDGLLPDGDEDDDPRQQGQLGKYRTVMFPP
jgi:hypothetical protein